jgi:endonuclease YncB( thermonuclease family)
MDQLMRRKAPLRGAFLLFGLLTLQACADGSTTDTIVVEHVIDGDTVVIEGGGKLRLLGINAPEKEFDQRPAQPYALEALLLLRQLTEGKTVRLVKGQVDKDKYGRLLGYLELLDGTDVQRALLEKGYSFAVAFPPDIDRLDRYQLAEAKARQQKLGVWRSKTWRPQNVDKDIDLSGGFGLFQGRIKSVKKSRKNVLFTMASGLTLTVRHQAWKAFWNTAPETLQGKRVIARGWVSEGGKSFKDQYFLRIRHPFMMQIDS